MSAEALAAPAISVDHRRTLRTIGAVGTGAGLLFAAMSVWQHAAVPQSGPAAAINQTGFAVAMAGYVVLAAGLAAVPPGGRRSRAFPLLVAIAWTALLASTALEALTPVNVDVLLPFGGLLQAVGLLGLGVSTVIARRWSGWRRFWPLGLALLFAGGLFVPAIVGIEPTAVVEVLWAMGYAGLGLALATECDPSSARRTSVGPIAALVVVTAGIVLTAVLTVGPEARSAARPATVPVVDDGRYGGPDVYEPRPGPHIPRFGSADTLEHYAG
jgi:hypothetical protein